MHHIHIGLILKIMQDQREARKEELTMMTKIIEIRVKSKRVQVF